MTTRALGVRDRSCMRRHSLRAGFALGLTVWRAGGEVGSACQVHTGVGWNVRGAERMLEMDGREVGRELGEANVPCTGQGLRAVWKVVERGVVERGLRGAGGEQRAEV